MKRLDNARNYTGPTAQVEQWRRNWVRTGAHPLFRPELARQLNAIRQCHGNQEARAYRDNLVWIGAYPASIR